MNTFNLDIFIPYFSLNLFNDFEIISFKKKFFYKLIYNKMLIVSNLVR